ncbi:MAG: TerC/Alx family metal homeostasis membrane protein [Verrucomicrobia bacterium]|nr:TerC/Alx family metal homeostasis membrane protein [Verrucomicrobiota bacterium]
MLALAEILSPHWVVFILAVLGLLALDLGLFHREARVVRFRDATSWTAFYVTASLLFGYALAPLMVEGWQRQQTQEFITGYILELSLSMDNVFVIAIIFGYFRVPLRFQHRVLFWGILGALIMRGILIWLGIELVHRFHWMLLVLGLFLVVTGIRMLLTKEEGVHPDRNLAIRAARTLFPVSAEFDGQRFITRTQGRLALTPLALVLLMVETTDLVFALDSIPAILGVTTNPYVVFTSNVFAILGLRSLYFVLAGAIGYFRFLKFGLSLVLVFIGVKMLIADTPCAVTTQVSLWVVGTIISVAIAASLVLARPKPRPELPPGTRD